MIDILSLPRRPQMSIIQVKNVRFKSGLPINSLPGWEHIPLNSKLPMLKCPGNQVIFSKNKIGQSFKHLKQDFDPSVRDSLPEYNPLHDSNLKNFYANERNLKRLRENGEITQQNDVICNLKDFNEYRQQLHKTRLYYVLQELNRLEIEQHDRMLINNAEAITTRDHNNLLARQNSYTEILNRKQQLDSARQRHYQRLWQVTESRMARLDTLKEMMKSLCEHRRALNNLKMQQHWDAAHDLQRKHLISLKKLFQFKKDRLKKNLQNLRDQRFSRAQRVQTRSWNRRLAERIENQKKMQKLLEEVATQRKVFIENHRHKYAEKWAKIQAEIQERSRAFKINSKLTEPPKRKRKRRRKKGELGRTDKKSSYCDYDTSLDKLLESDLCNALNTALDMEQDIKLPIEPDDPICKAAKFIINHIINKFDKDLSGDKLVCTIVSERVDKFFDEAKKLVMFRASQIIANIRETFKKKGVGSNSSVNADNRRQSLSKFVSFNRFARTIGHSSYKIHPLINIKGVGDRTPTPPGSLASVKVDSEENLVDKAKVPHLCRNELIFIEHYIIKFKRELIVGIGKRVFAAIECHFDNKIMDVRKELIDLDRKFLICHMSKAILSYAHNPLNYEASIKLCISALASDIIWSLQKHLLKPERDPRGIVGLRHCAGKDVTHMKLCLYCHP